MLEKCEGIGFWKLFKRGKERLSVAYLCLALKLNYLKLSKGKERSEEEWRGMGRGLDDSRKVMSSNWTMEKKRK